MIPHNTLAVLRFELRRTLTVSRIGIWLMLVMFPIFIISVMKYYEEDIYNDEPEQEREIQKVKVDDYVFVYRPERRTFSVRLGDSDDALEYDIPIPADVSREEAVSYLVRLGQAHSDPLALMQIIAELKNDMTRKPKPVSGPSPDQVKEMVWGIAISVLSGVITLLGLLLWATPVVQADLEGRTWIYLAVRPRGRASVLLGKFSTAVIWTTLAGGTSASICLYIAQPPHAWLLWRSILVVIALGSMGYGALFCLIGVMIPRRAMVIAVAYTLIFEFLVSFIPAVINQFTVHYRLRNLLVQFMGWRELLPDGTGEVLLGDQPAWLHIAILALFVVTLLVVATQAVQLKEYVTADEA